MHCTNKNGVKNSSFVSKRKKDASMNHDRALRKVRELKKNKARYELREAKWK